MSVWGSALGGASAGAGTGFMVGGAPGAAIGGGLGLLGAYLGAKEEERAKRRQALMEAEQTRYAPYLGSGIGQPKIAGEGNFGKALAGVSSGAAMYQQALRNQNEEKLLAQGVNPYSGLNARAYNLNFNPDGLRTSSDMQNLMTKYNVGTF